MANSMQLQCVAMYQFIKRTFPHVKNKDEFIIKILSGSLNQQLMGNIQNKNETEIFSVWNRAFHFFGE